MTSRKSINWAALLFLGCFCLITLTDNYVARKAPFASDQRVLSYALLIDYVLVIPLMYWLLIVRKKGGGVLKALQIILPCAVLAWFALPASGRELLTNASLPLKLLIAAFEALVIFIEVKIAYGLVKRYREVRLMESSTAEALRISVTKGRNKPSVLASLIVNDLLMVYYLFFSWKRKGVPSQLGVLSFTYHRKSGQMLLAAVFTHIIVIEAFAMHLLVANWSAIAAWILTGADIWLLSHLWADSRASALQPLEVRENQLRIRYGMRIQADIPYDCIARVDTALEFHPDKAESKHAVLPVVTPNVRIKLSKQMEVQSLLFLPRKVDTIFLAVDEREDFAGILREKCNF
ncbi:hypothetical protein G8C92_22550 [Paenibacillus donghaensis]|uniref:hypothetical protein n=1 Tax=Paenibacillus donghaensis TaxID=414771 RepID=UPI001883879B|nr:hypothetical protein [Paenibacillus donghaensis]MBE9916802.1 hypothetical protein [Paenibacillus donghaensis]